MVEVVWGAGPRCAITSLCVACIQKPLRCARQRVEVPRPIQRLGGSAAPPFCASGAMVDSFPSSQYALALLGVGSGSLSGEGVGVCGSGPRLGC